MSIVLLSKTQQSLITAQWKHNCVDTTPSELLSLELSIYLKTVFYKAVNFHKPS